MITRDYGSADAATLCRLFFETVRSVNAADYSEEQLWAWAPEIPDTETWHERMSGRHTLVAEEEGQIVGFAELEGNGHLDMFYVRKDAVGRGVGSCLYAAVEGRALELGPGRLFTEASITARPFFERHGFVVLGRNVLARRGVELVNYSMEKALR